jgi:hypothetical protein
MRQSIFLDELKGPSTVGTHRVKFPKNVDVYNAALRTSTAVALADVSTVRLLKVKNGEEDKLLRSGGKSGTQVLWEVTGTQLDEVNKVDGITDYATAGRILKLNFEELKLKLPAAQYSTAMPVRADETLMIEVVTGGATAPVWTAYADVNDDMYTGARYVRRVRQYGASFAVTGERNTDALPYGTSEDRYWRRIFSKADAGTITNSRITLGAKNSEIFNRLTSYNLDRLSDLGFVTGAYWGEIIDFAETGVLHPLDLSQYKAGDTYVKLWHTNANAANYTFIAETYGDN